MTKAIKKVAASALDTPKSKMEDGLRKLATYVSGPLTSGQRAEVYEVLAVWEKSIKGVKEVVRTNMLQLLQDIGTVKSEKGTLVCEVDGWAFEARPQNTGFDDEKVEALLRSKKLDPEEHMTQTISFKTDPIKLGRVLTNEEIKSCKKEMSYAVQTPKRVTNV